MCVDYSDLNRACPKDFYPLPNIDQLIDSTAGHELLSFMDAFLGYNQIKMDCNDWEKTTFITHKGVFTYNNMSFGLINGVSTNDGYYFFISNRQEYANLRRKYDNKVEEGSKPCH